MQLGVAEHHLDQVFGVIFILWFLKKRHPFLEEISPLVFDPPNEIFAR